MLVTAARTGGGVLQIQRATRPHHAAAFAPRKIVLFPHDDARPAIAASVISPLQCGITILSTTVGKLGFVCDRQ
jgi:hypothetical protein